MPKSMEIKKLKFINKLKQNLSSTMCSKEDFLTIPIHYRGAV